MFDVSLLFMDFWLNSSILKHFQMIELILLIEKDQLNWFWEESVHQLWIYRISVNRLCHFVFDGSSFISTPTTANRWRISVGNFSTIHLQSNETIERWNSYAIFIKQCHTFEVTTSNNFRLKYGGLIASLLRLSAQKNIRLTAGTLTWLKSKTECFISRIKNYTFLVRVMNTIFFLE